MNCPKKYNKVGKQCGDKYHAFIVEVFSIGLSLSVLGYRQDIIRFIHGWGVFTQTWFLKKWETRVFGVFVRVQLKLLIIILIWIKRKMKEEETLNTGKY